MQSSLGSQHSATIDAIPVEAAMETEKRITIYLVVVGVLLLAAAWVAILEDSEAPAATLSLLGAGALVLAPFVSLLEGRIRVGPVEMKLRERLVEAAIDADEAILRGVLTFLQSEEVSVGIRDLPRGLAGHKLTDSELAFVRTKLNLQAVAARLPGEDRWRGGGQLSDLLLPAGTKLLLVGPRDSIGAFGEGSAQG
jgi:hypothetical protein